MVSQCTKFEVSRFTRYEAVNGGEKMQKMGWFVVVRGHSRSSATPPFDRAHTTSYSTTLIESERLDHTVFTARRYASAVLAMGLCVSVSVCPSLCHKWEFY